MNFDLAVAWRIYPKISKKPLLFDNDKLSLVRLSLISFLKSTEGLNIKYYFILDGCPPDYVHLINSLFKEKKYEIIQTNGIGNLSTFQLQIDILSNQSESELVYFAEDDYLYIPHKFQFLISLMEQNPKIDFSTGYFHSDIFNHPIHRHSNRIKIKCDDQDWINASSTCLTFMTRKKILVEAKKILETYSKGNNDCAMWLVLTKNIIYNPYLYFKFYFTHKESFNILKTAVKYSFRYFFTLKKYQLWIATPALCTHLESEFISPGIDWIKLADEINACKINR